LLNPQKLVPPLPTSCLPLALVGLFPQVRKHCSRTFEKQGKSPWELKLGEEVRLGFFTIYKVRNG